MKNKQKPNKTRRVKELEDLIQECDYMISEADSAEYQLEKYQEEYEKLTGERYEY